MITFNIIVIPSTGGDLPALTVPAAGETLPQSDRIARDDANRVDAQSRADHRDCFIEIIELIDWRSN